MKSMFAFLMLVFCVSIPAKSELLTNGSFEQEFVNGWTISGAYEPALVPGLLISGVSISPVNDGGVQFALLRCGGGTTGNSQEDAVSRSYSEISQVLNIGAGHKITGYYFFATSDYRPYDDTSYITLTPAGGDPLIIRKKSVTDVGDYRAMPGWEYFETDTLAAGSYTLAFRVQDQIDTILASYLAVDNLAVVPEPTTLVLLSFGAIAFRRLKR